MASPLQPMAPGNPVFQCEALVESLAWAQHILKPGLISGTGMRRHTPYRGSAMMLEKTLWDHPDAHPYFVSVFHAPKDELFSRWFFFFISWINNHDNDDKNGRFLYWKWTLRLVQVIVMYYSMYALPRAAMDLVPSDLMNELPDEIVLIIVVFWFVIGAPLGHMVAHGALNSVTYWIGAEMTLSPKKPNWVAIEALRRHGTTYNEALFAVQKQLQDFPENVRLQAYKIELSARVKILSGIRTRAETLAKQHPEDFDVLYALKQVYDALKRPADADKVSERLAEIRPEYKYAKTLRARLVQSGSWPQVQVEWNEALRLNYFRALRVIALFMVERGYTVEAVQFVSAYLDNLDKPTSHAIVLLADVLAYRAEALYGAKFYSHALKAMRQSFEVARVLKHIKTLNLWFKNPEFAARVVKAQA